MKIFRKIRQSMIAKSKFRNYIVYAIGEILLVMIGILLALQVNNWNEKRNKHKQLNTILSTVSFDLATDTLAAEQIVDFYEKNNENSLRIINKEINMDNYQECPSCPSLVSIYRTMTIQQKGFELLRNFSNQESIQNDTLVTSISQFYTIFIKMIDDSNSFVKNEVLNNLESFKKHDWFVTWTQGKYNDDMIRYFAESEDYRKRVAAHNLLAAQNHLLYVQSYKTNATEIIRLINERLSNEDGD